MVDEQRDQPTSKPHRFLFEGFGSEEETQAARERLELWLSLLQDWKSARWNKDVPDRTRN